MFKCLFNKNGNYILPNKTLICILGIQHYITTIPLSETCKMRRNCCRKMRRKCAHKCCSCESMMKAPLIGSICTLVGLVFAVYVYVDTSDGVTVDDKNLWVREEGK